MAYDNHSIEGRARAEELMRRHDEMAAERSVLDSLYQRIAERVCPEGEIFTSKQAMQGELGGERVFDNTPAIALDRFAAAISSYLVPDSDQWHGLKASDPDLIDDEESKEYLEEVTNVLFAARYRPRANFSAQMNACFRSLGAYGPWAMFVDEAMGASLRYRAMHLSELVFGENHQGLVDRVHRGKFALKAYQVEQLANDPDPSRRWTMPECVKKALEGPRSSPNAAFEFIHCVYPNEEWRPHFADYRGMAFASTYLNVNDRSICNMGGYRAMPYAVGRYLTGPRETYGRSPAMSVFRDILMLNEMNKSVIRQAQMTLEPPYLIHEDGALQPFNAAPRSLNPGFVTDEGRPLVHALRPEGDIMVGLEMIQDRRNAINDAFMISLFRILVDEPKATATEALLRAQEKGQILGPAMSRQQDALGVMIEREIDILGAAGQLPPMPEQLREGGVAIEFKAPVNRLQKTDAAVGILRTIETMAIPAEADPSVWDVMDMPKAMRIIGEANGAPASVMRTPEEMAELSATREQKASVDTLVAAAPQLAKTVRDISQAQATAGNVPPPIPLVQPSGR